jgi:hypothetical protein
MERLEDRQMMAGDVRAYVQNGDLYIVEDAAQIGQASNVRLTQEGGNIRVRGFDPPGSDVPSKVNGGASQIFAVTGNLIVRLGAGHDILQLGEPDGTRAPSFRSAQIDLGAPAVTRGTAPQSPTLLDDDNVLIWTAKTSESMTIVTGEGQDVVFVGSASIGDGSGADLLKINTGNGGDGVKLKGATIHGNVDIQTYGALAEGNVDFVGFDAGDSGPTKVDGHVNVRTGGGDDLFFLGDPAYLPGFVAFRTNGSLVVDMGAGSDRLEMHNARIGDAAAASLDKDLVIRMGAGADSATLFNVNVQEYIDLQLHAADEADADIVALDHVFAHNGDMSIRTGGGNDSISLANLTAYRNLFVEAGAGDDHLDLFDYVLALGSANLSGGAGQDVLNFHNGNLFTTLYQSGWESILEPEPVSRQRR